MNTERLVALLAPFLCALPGLVGQSGPYVIGGHTGPARLVAGHHVRQVLYGVPCGQIVFHDRDGRTWLAGNEDCPIVLLDRERIEPQAFGRSGWRDWQGWAGPGFHLDPSAPPGARSIAQSGDGNIWVLASGYLDSKHDGYLARYDGKHWSQAPFPSFRMVAGLIGTMEDRLWCWTDDEIRSYDGLQWSAPLSLSRELGGEAASQPDYAIHCAVEDRVGIIWLATFGGALVTFDKNRRKLTMVESSGPHADLMWADRSGHLWLGIRDGCWVERYDRTSGSVLSYDLAALGKGCLGGLRRSDGFGGYVDSWRLTSICEDNEGVVLFGIEYAPAGILTYNEARNQWGCCSYEDLGLDYTDVISVTRDSQGQIWVGAGAGMLVLNP
jgi:ligand-binding sensor domain-containing protein